MGSLVIINYFSVVSLFLLLSPCLCDDDSARCNVDSCWEKYNQANQYYQADLPGIANKPARLCIVLRTYKACLNELRPFCLGDIGYQAARRILQVQYRNGNCSNEGPIYPEGPEPETQPTATPCRFKGNSIYSYCSLFGDPHLQTFRGKQSTCRLRGAWPLVDNEFLTVQVSNAQLSPDKSIATVTRKVTVVVKGVGSDAPSGEFCGSRNAIFYHAEAGSLPGTFSDGQREHGAYSSIQVQVKIPGEEVEIYLRYIDSTVIIRQISSQYLSVGVRIPEEVLNGTLRNPDATVLRQLCLDGCPASEVIDVSQYLTDLSIEHEQRLVAQIKAKTYCQEAGVTDFFFDACVFDLVMTDDRSFTTLAASAYRDVKRYASRQPRWLNRTNLRIYNEMSQPVKITSDANSIEKSTLITRTFLFVYIMHVVASLLIFVR